MFRDHPECRFPRKRRVVRRSVQQDHRLGNAALAVVPEIAFRGEFCDGVLCEKPRVRQFAGGFGCERLGTIFTKLGEGTIMVRIRPGAARAIESARLVHFEQPPRAAERTGLAKDVVQRGRHRRHASGPLLGFRCPDFLNITHSTPNKRAGGDLSSGKRSLLAKLNILWSAARARYRLTK